MSQSINPEQMASEWATRIASRLRQMDIPDQEVHEIQVIVEVFTKTAIAELLRDPKVSLPYTHVMFEVKPEQIHEIIDLFLRGVNQCASKLRKSGKPWSERKVMLENLAWKLFNLAKLLVGFMHVPNPAISNILNGSKDLQLMMKQSTEVLLQEEITGKPASGMPFKMNL